MSYGPLLGPFFCILTLVDREYPLLEEAYKSGRGHVIREYGLHTYGAEKWRAEFLPVRQKLFLSVQPA